MPDDMAPEPEDLRARRQRIFGQSSRSRPRGRVIVVAVLAAIVVGGGAWSAIRMLTHSGSPGQVPIIRADDQPVRKRPSDPGGQPIPEQDSMLYNQGKPDTKVEQLLPPPEAPLPRPAPPPEPEPPAAAAADTAPPPATPAPAPAVIAAAPAPPPAVTPSAPPASPPVVPPKPAPAALEAPAPHAAPPPAAPSPTKAIEGYRLQLGAVRSPDNAKQAWEKLKRSHGDILGTLAFNAYRVDLGARGIFYRIQAGPVRDAATAERDCGELKRRGVGCIIVRP
jgi:hypothetical protein